MARLTADMISALTAATVRAEFLVELDYPSGADRFWSGLMDIVWNGDTWDAIGRPERIENIEETTELRATNTQIVISGIPSAYVSNALSENYRNRTGKIYLCCVKSSDPTQVVADPIEIFSGYMDQQTISDDGQTATITIDLESKMIDFTRPRRKLWTHEDQQIANPGDLGLQYVAELQNKEIIWGR